MVDITIRKKFPTLTGGNDTELAKRSTANNYNHTLFTLFYKKKQLLRIDMQVKYTKWNGYSGWVHYHIPPNLKTHYDLFTIQFGKNQPKFPWK